MTAPPDPVVSRLADATYGQRESPLDSSLKQICFRVARGLGLFGLARRLTSGQLRILCYHGGSVRDEHLFRPVLFMSGDTFRSRMALLKQLGYPVMGLSDALAARDNGTLPPCAVVLTVDDGWAGTHDVMAPVLAEYQLPATLYLCTYYLQKQLQVFNVAVGYVLWRARSRALDLAELDSRLSGRFDLSRAEVRDRVQRQLEVHGESLSTAEARQQLLRQLCTAIGEDWQALETLRITAFMSPDEARSMAAAGWDLQLHTHRHRFPADRIEAERELTDNRRVLAELGQPDARHFCFPSGEYSRSQLPWLLDARIESATTTDTGLVSASASRLELPRILDAETWTSVEFEAELSGFAELLRRWTGRRKAGPH